MMERLTPLPIPRGKKYKRVYRNVDVLETEFTSSRKHAKKILRLGYHYPVDAECDDGTGWRVFQCRQKNI